MAKLIFLNTGSLLNFKKYNCIKFIIAQFEINCKYVYNKFGNYYNSDFLTDP